MKHLDSNAIVALCFSTFMIVLVAITFTLDGYRVYQKHHTFQVAYQSAMNCRAVVGASGKYDAYTHVNQICRSLPKMGDLE